MEENNENFGNINKLALITDSIDKFIPNGKAIIVFELNNEDYNKIKSEFIGTVTQRKNTNKFSIDISGTEVVFLLEDSYILEEPKEEPKPGFFKRLFKFKK